MGYRMYKSRTKFNKTQVYSIKYKKTCMKKTPFILRIDHNNTNRIIYGYQNRILL